MTKDLSSNWLLQRNLAESLTVLCAMNSEPAFDQQYKYTSVNTCNHVTLGNTNTPIYVDYSGGTTYINTSENQGFQANYQACPSNLSTEEGRTEYIACVKSSFHKD